MILTVTLNPCVHRYLLYREPAAPSSVVRGVQARASSGGKGLNAARVVVQLGGEAMALATACGATGELLRECLARERVPAELVPVAVPTRVSTCVWDVEHHWFREYLEEGGGGDAAAAAELSRRFALALPQVGIVTVNGSTPAGAFEPLPRQFVAAARAAGRTVVLDAYGPAAQAAATVPPHWLRANLDELRTTWGVSGSDDLEPFRRRLGVDGVVISDGPRALHCVTAARHLVAQPPPVREVSAVGSGDALTGAFALALERGLPLDEALRWGAAAGAANAEQLLVCEFAPERWRTLAAGVRVEVRR
ncbi:MAG: hypothetical protein FJ293_07585 [Planctomycetes bacterium]|nr:hypothetical protein [Planctomycetota bacterium]